MFQKIITRIKYHIQRSETQIRSLLKRSDLNRWKSKDSLKPEWDSRTIQMSGYIRPGSKVIEFGAGRMILRDHLDASVYYTPSDIVARSEDTIVCDLNSALPDIEKYDYAVFSGVLEYIYDIPQLINFLQSRADIIIASYATVERSPDHRQYFGWVNNYNDQDFQKIFTNEGYVLDNQEAWNKQTIYVFRKANATG